MSTTVTTVTVTHRYLMRRSKDALITWIEQIHRTLGTTPTHSYAAMRGWMKYYLAREVLRLMDKLPEDPP